MNNQLTKIVSFWFKGYDPTRDEFLDFNKDNLPVVEIFVPTIKNVLDDDIPHIFDFNAIVDNDDIKKAGAPFQLKLNSDKGLYFTRKEKLHENEVKSIEFEFKFDISTIIGDLCYDPNIGYNEEALWHGLVLARIELPRTRWINWDERLGIGTTPVQKENCTFVDRLCNCTIKRTHIIREKSSCMFEERTVGKDYAINIYSNKRIKTGWFVLFDNSVDKTINDNNLDIFIDVWP